MASMLLTSMSPHATAGRYLLSDITLNRHPRDAERVAFEDFAIDRAFSPIGFRGMRHSIGHCLITSEGEYFQRIPPPLVTLIRVGPKGIYSRIPAPSAASPCRANASNRVMSNRNSVARC